MNPSVFNNPFKRRSVYKRAHSDPALAEWVRTNDPKFGSRSKLTRFETIINDATVAAFLPIGSVLEFTVGNAIDAYERGRARSRIGKVYDAVKYEMFDPFHRKRILYDLDSRRFERK